MLVFPLVKKHILHIEYHYNFELYALLCPLKEYKLAWQLGRALGMNFRKDKDLTVPYTRGDLLYLSNLSYKTDYYKLMLVKNRVLNRQNVFLIPEIKEFDYFLHIRQQEDDMLDMVLIEHQVSRLESIVLCQKINAAQLPSRANLLFD